jgi:hypothetical protein
VGAAQELKASDAAIARVVHSFLHPRVPRTPKAHHGAKTPKLPHKDITVLVLNASDVRHEAAHTSSALHHEGFATKNLPKSVKANAPARTWNTVIYYNSSSANGLPAAKELGPLFGKHVRLAVMTPEIMSLADKAQSPLTVVAIGGSFKGKLDLPSTGGLPRGATANARVTNGLPVALAAVRAENGPAHFPLMVPHRVANGSTISTQEGVRLFRPLKGKQELVLTFNLYNGIEYWQIEESNWTSEPFLSKPTARFTYRGREYAEFTSGGKIQQIAVYSGRNVYWVQNSILNTLSNPTMIAIAESLQPLR